MDTIEARLNQYQPQMLSIFRIMFGLLVLQHGFSKWFGFPVPGPAGIQLMTMVGVAGVIELVAGTLITIGLFTRYAAFFVAGRHRRRILDDALPAWLDADRQQRRSHRGLLLRRATARLLRWRSLEPRRDAAQEDLTRLLRTADC